MTISPDSRKAQRHEVERQARKKARINNLRRAEKGGVRLSAAVVLGAVLLGGASAAVADTTQLRPGDFTWAGYEDGSYKWRSLQILNATDAEVQELGDKYEGVMRGTVGLSADESKLQASADAGAPIDLDGIAERANHDLEDRQKFAGYVNPDLDLNTGFAESIDRDKLRAKAIEHGLDPDTARYEIRTVRADHKLFVANIAPEPMWSAPDIKAGQKVISGDTVATSDTDGHSWEGPSIYPNVAVTDEGPMLDSGEFRFALTTIVDPYSNGTSNERKQQILSANERAMPEDTANCLIDDCGFVILPVIVGETPEDKAFNDEKEAEGENRGSWTSFALTAPIRVDVDTTVSAGEAPTSVKLSSGDTVRFVPEMHDDSTHTSDNELLQGGDYFNDPLGPWDLLAEHTQRLALLSDRSVAINNIALEDGTFTIGTESNHSNISSGHYTEGDEDFIVLRVVKPSGDDEGVSEWTYGDEALTVGDELRQYLRVGEDRLILTMTVVSVDDNTVVFSPSGEWEDSGEEWVIPEGLNPVVDGIPISVGVSALGGMANFQRTPGFYLEVTEAVVPEPEPTPTPTPTPEQPEPTPVPEPPVDTPEPPVDTPEPPVVDEPTPEPPVVDEPTPEPPVADEPDPTTPPITNTMTTPPDVAVEQTMNAGASEEQSALMRAWTAVGGASLVGALAGGLFFLRNRRKLQPIEVESNQG
ncbi:hypothetical protein [Citricoccus nitrophenolicus]|uniref:hypothetical protein n=1 Tax=Citricoccus nitrophenolicus TaxID=863575 RepID=UPI0031ED0BDC